LNWGEAMQPALLSLVVFAAISLLLGAVLLVVRDLRASRRPVADPARGPKGAELASIALPSAADEDRVGAQFTRLVTETGWDITPDAALLLAIAMGLALGGGLFLWRDDALAAAAGAILGFLAAGGWLFYLRSRRLRAIREQLPDVLDLMARSVRAGQSVDQAIALAGDSDFQPVAAEFRRCAKQLDAGLSLDAAIRALVRRVPLAEMRVLAVTLIVQRQTGGSLPTALERLAAVFRDRLNYFRQFRAATAAGRGSALLIAAIAIGIDVVVIAGRPEYARELVESAAGQIMLAISLALQILGLAWAFWVFRSNY
jgi:tight adherence protein B